MADTFNKKREQILDTAARLFNEKGFDTVSVMDICQACGITKPTFYRYVVSKESILSDMFDKGEELILPQVKELHQEGKLMNALWTGLTGTVYVAESIGSDILRSYIIMLLRDNTKPSRLNDDLKDELIEVIGELQDDGRILNHSDPNDIYRLSVFLNRGLMIMWSMGEGGFDLRDTFRQSMVSILKTHDASDMFTIHEISLPQA